MTIDEWHLIAFTYDSSELTLYLDGLIAANTPAEGEPAKENNYNFEIGRSRAHGGSNREHFGGMIDEVAIRALQSYEIDIHYNNGLNDKGYCEEAQKSEECEDGNCSLVNATVKEEPEIINQSVQEAETPKSSASKTILVVSVLIILIAVGAAIMLRKKK